MLLRPLITFLVLTIKIGNTSAMVPQSLDKYNSPPPAPIAAPLSHSSPNAHSSTYRSSNNPQNQLPQRIPIPLENPKFNFAKCEMDSYNLEAILYARAEGCNRMPFYVHPIGTRLAVPYYPARIVGIQESPPFYLYPIGKPLMNTKTGPHYGPDRIILNKDCQAIGVLSELPTLCELARKAGRLMIGKHCKDYKQNRYRYQYCQVYNLVPAS